MAAPGVVIYFRKEGELSVRLPRYLTYILSSRAEEHSRANRRQYRT